MRGFLLLAATALAGTGAEQLGAAPRTLVIEPRSAVLEGPRALQQVAVTIGGPSGPERDVTREAELFLEPHGIAAISAAGVLEPLANGRAVLKARLGSLEAAAPVEVRGAGGPEPVSFRREVVALFAREGCSSGACHGAPSGKNGFRLSLRGHDPAADLGALLGESLSRRADRIHPEASLLLLKPAGLLPHGGGKRFASGSRSYRLLRDWIAGGLEDDPGAAALARIEVSPSRRVLPLPAAGLQLLVTAVFADGTRRDVTGVAVFTLDEERVAGVETGGWVERRGRGEVTVLARYLDQLATARIAFLPESRAGGGSPAASELESYVDRHVFAKLDLLGIPPAPLSTDAEFIRRLYLDTLAVLPLPEETRAFLADPRPDKRERLIEEVLERPEFDEYWSMKWLDVLRSSRKVLGRRAVHGLQRWMRNAIATRLPLDELARRLLTASGEVNEHPEANFYRIAQDAPSRTEAASQLFLGVRIGCARCHNHPFERWTQADYHGLASFFTGVSIKGAGPKASGNNAEVGVDRQSVWVETGAAPIVNPRSGAPEPPRFLGEREPLAGQDGADRRALFAAWLTAPENPFFSRSLANRIWYHLFGRGIVEPVDDFRDSNPPSNEELLAALAEDLQRSGYDLRHLVRTILRSRTYQLGWQAAPGGEEGTKYFAHAAPRLLGAEQLLDAISRVSGVPEPFPGLPAGTRAVALPDGATAGFLATFGKPERDSACECERESEATLIQALELAGGDTLHRKLRDAGNRIGRLLAAGAGDPKIVEELYLAALCRPPSAEEWKTAWAHMAAAPDRRQGLEDLLWALFNSREFLFRR
jgi:hypothetical protein